MQLPKLKYLVIGAVILIVLVCLLKKFMTDSPMQMMQEPGMDMPMKYVDPGMADVLDTNAFGTTNEADRRWENASVRKEFNKDPFPLAEGCGSTPGCAKKGCPDPADGHSHVCRCGPPSKRMIDAHGSNFMLPHMCAPCTSDSAEPTQLGRWWKRKGCSAPESVGLDLRPICSRCGD